MTPGYFITGTDTGVGKTFFSVALLHRLEKQGCRVAGMKPVASGCEVTADGLRNDDALRLMAACSTRIAYPIVNPYAFEPPIAPHLAAQQCDASIEIEQIQKSFMFIKELADTVIVEGVGGWLVPINTKETMADVARVLDLPVILVVGIKLGCLNAALLTVSAIEQKGLRCAGWVANRIDRDCLCADENIAALQQRISAPLLAEIPWMGANSERCEINWRDFERSG